MTDLKNENKGLKERIQAMNNERGDLQINKLQEELATAYRRFRDECSLKILMKCVQQKWQMKVSNLQCLESQ